MGTERLEIELKLEITDVDAVVCRLVELGADLRAPRAFEDNRVYDFPDRSLTRAGRLLRLREFAGRATLTAKGPSAESDPRYKIRREEEVNVADAESFAAMLECAGFETLWRYQKYRRAYAWKDTEVVVDETPAGDFVEIEGLPASIEELVAQLDSLVSRRITGSYRDVWEESRGSSDPGDMVFAADRERS